MQKKITVPLLRSMKRQEKIVALSCYSYMQSRMCSDIEIDLLLVGDSLGSVMLGYDSTIPVTMEEMIHHTRAVARGNTHCLLAADMPFMSYQPSDRDAIHNAGRLIKDGRAEAVKVEGGGIVCDRVRAIVSMGIPVIAHLGLLPQSVHAMGGYKVQAKDEVSAQHLIEDAKRLEDAGAFALVLECIPEALARIVTEKISIPTIGIGAGRFCDGQILVCDDIVGLTEGHKKFVKVYDDLGTKMKAAVAQYKDDVKKGVFPDEKSVIV